LERAAEIELARQAAHVVAAEEEVAAELIGDLPAHHEEGHAQHGPFHDDIAGSGRIRNANSMIHRISLGEHIH
jgi:hypothetical protein